MQVPLCDGHRCVYAAWLVIFPYDESGPTGRLLVYCDECRRNNAERFSTVLPQNVLDIDADAVLTVLYNGGATLTEPDAAAEVIGVEMGPWADVARNVIARRA